MTALLNLLISDNNVILFRPEINRKLKCPEATLLLSQAIYWWKKQGMKKFYKFKSKPSKPHPAYKKDGSSWIEELGITKYGFEEATKILGEERGILIGEYERSDHLYWWDINVENLEKFLEECFVEPEKVEKEHSEQEIDDSSDTHAKYEGQISPNTKVGFPEIRRSDFVLEKETTKRDPTVDSVREILLENFKKFQLDEERKEIAKVNYKLTDFEILEEMINFKSEQKYLTNPPQNPGKTFFSWLSNKYMDKSKREYQLQKAKEVEDKIVEIKVSRFQNAVSQNGNKNWKSNQFSNSSREETIEVNPQNFESYEEFEAHCDKLEAEGKKIERLRVQSWIESKWADIAKKKALEGKTAEEIEREEKEKREALAEKVKAGKEAMQKALEGKNQMRMQIKKIDDVEGPKIDKSTQEKLIREAMEEYQAKIQSGEIKVKNR